VVRETGYDLKQASINKSLIYFDLGIANIQKVPRTAFGRVSVFYVFAQILYHLAGRFKVAIGTYENCNII
jgi:hypothetical protein